MFKFKKLKTIILLALVASLGTCTTAFASTEREITYYNQGDYADCPFSGSTVKGAGCGITAFAMVASLYGKDITPADIAELANNNGSYYNTVSNHEAITNLAEYYGLPVPAEMGGILMNCCESQDYDEAYLREELENGSAIIVSQTGGYFNPSYRGHYTVLYGMGENGPIVYDPGSRSRTEKIQNNDGFDWESLFSQSKHIWIFPSYDTIIKEKSKALTTGLNRVHQNK